MKKVLIIDDNDVFAKVVTDSLSKDTYEVSHAVNGEEGLALIKNNRPDIILLDMMMPKMGGLDFLEHLKNEKQEKKIPILISSELSSTKDISEAVASGIDIGVKGYIIKADQNMQMIVSTIETTLNNEF